MNFHRPIAGPAPADDGPQPPPPRDLLLIADAAVDGLGATLSPAGLLWAEGRVLALGTPEHAEVAAQAQARATGAPVARVELPRRVIFPAFVNAHAHLDLTHLGPRPYGGDFISWIENVVRHRPRDEAAIEGAVRDGLKIAHRSGVCALGDIAGSVAAAGARIEAGLIPGASWLECFGLGPAGEEAVAPASESLRKLRAIAQSRAAGSPVSVALQPHAPYSAGAALFEAADADSAQAGAPASSHLAETTDEDRFVRHAQGPFADLLRRWGKWDGSVQPTGESPVRHQSQRLRRGRWVLAHLNYVSDDDLDLLRQGRERLSVAYCPIASAYFGHHGHRYRAMLDRGINVCLGTDSLACAGPLDPQPLGPLAAMRLLHRRDGTDSVTALAMATVHGHRALCSPHADGSLRRPGALLACPYDPGDREPALTQVLRHDHPVTRVAG